MSDIPQIFQPFTFDLRTGDVVTVEQDSIDDIAQCVKNICSYIKGTREERPDFGITDQTFEEGGVDINKLRQEVEEFEPRASMAFSTTADWVALAESVGIRVTRSEDNIG